jgi:hypothetical protein
MPASLVNMAFTELFGMEKFTINEQSIFSISPKGTSIEDFKAKCGDVKGLARIVASSVVKGKPGINMASLFGVSLAAMAIRLEELGLIEF